eukprot:TRINITY_DN36200_c0_g1_i4.p1 TRINITY_DN36200_c0_g1~~TRINITY_DN36200_c0_g1_i4.p1  ORF type:complete len:323 (-),score=93.21 TRINITY_DN36200_c0_g1_i4:119-1087(-)
MPSQPAPRKKKLRKKAKAESVADAAAQAAASADAAAPKEHVSEGEEPKSKAKGGRARKARTAAKKRAAEETAAAEAAKRPAKAAPAAADEEEVSRTVFVDGVPYDWSEAQVSEHFKQCGEVVRISAPVWQDSGRLRGYAHVTFANADAQRKAMAMDGQKVGKKGRYLKIEAAKTPSSDGKLSMDLEGKRRLFCKNLPYDATEAEIAALFQDCGKILEVRVPTNAGRAKGFAYVEFAKAEFLKAAVEMSPPASLRGRTLRLDVDTGSGPKAGFHARPEAYGSGYGPDSNPRGRGRGGRGGGKGDGKGGGRGHGRGGGLSLSLF